jgi:hypothetical protein
MTPALGIFSRIRNDFSGQWKAASGGWSWSGQQGGGCGMHIVSRFRPVEDLRGVFGDPHARVVTLVRRSKKRRAGHVDDNTSAGTIARFGALAIWQPAAYGYSWSSRCGASGAVIAAR